MDELYPTNPNPRTSENLLPMLREMFSRFPEYRHHQGWELQWLLFALGYTEELEDEHEIASAATIARRDFDPDEGAA
jgi:hypothetical protein